MKVVGSLNDLFFWNYWDMGMGASRFLFRVLVTIADSVSLFERPRLHSRHSVRAEIPNANNSWKTLIGASIRYSQFRKLHYLLKKSGTPEYTWFFPLSQSADSLYLPMKLQSSEQRNIFSFCVYYNNQFSEWLILYDVIFFEWDIFANQPIRGHHLAWIAYANKEKMAITPWEFFYSKIEYFSEPLLVRTIRTSYQPINSVMLEPRKLRLIQRKITSITKFSSDWCYKAHFGKNDMF